MAKAPVKKKGFPEKGFPPKKGGKVPKVPPKKKK
jgi:hypothetical protein